MKIDDKNSLDLRSVLWSLKQQTYLAVIETVCCSLTGHGVGAQWLKLVVSKNFFSAVKRNFKKHFSSNR